MFLYKKKERVENITRQATCVKRNIEARRATIAATEKQ
jgi:hypothetical protein